MNKSSAFIESEADYHDKVASKVEINDKLIKELTGYDSPAGYTANHLPQLKKELLYVLGNVSGLRVLVYGCGSDSAALWFAKSGAYVDAIDISPKSIENQKMMAKKSGLEINYHVMDAHDLNFPDNAFDIVYGNAILHHLELDKASTEIRRVMAVEGAAIFRDVLQGNILLRLFRYFTPGWRTPDEHPLTPNDL